MTPLRTYRRDRYTLVGVEHPNDDGRSYDVYAPDGKFAGQVGTYQATMERRSKGARYVNARWSSERWWAREWGEDKRHHLAFTTPGEAALWLIDRDGETP